MKLEIDRSVLLKAMAVANGVVERRNTIPILSNVRLDAGDDVLRLTATDLDIEIRLDVAARVEQEGAVTVDSAMLHDLAKKLPDGAVIRMETGAQRMTVQSGRSRFALQTLPADDFPDLSLGAAATVMVLPAPALRRIFAKTLFAVSSEETRYYLYGVYLHRADGVLTRVATDGHRLAKTWLADDVGVPDFPGVIVPRKTCAMLVKNLDGVTGDVRLGISQTMLVAEWGAVRLVSKLIDGTFPDYDRVVPKTNELVAVIDCDAVSTAVDRVATVSSERGRAVRFDFGLNSLGLAVNAPDQGSGEETLEIAYGGMAMTIGFNSRYVLDVLANLDCDVVRMQMADGGAPVILRPCDGDMDCMALIMPMRA